jgi:hypothetical protein
MPRPHRLLALVTCACLAVTGACSSTEDSGDEPPNLTTPTTRDLDRNGPDAGQPPGDQGYVVFNAQGNHLDAYDPEPPFAHQRVVTAAAEDPENGRDMNGQICFFPDGSRRFVAGEDTGQDEGIVAGWGIFQLTGDGIGDFETRQVGKMVPTYQDPGGSEEDVDETADADKAEPYGCGFLADGRIVTTDVGNQAAGDPTGQLTLWFPPFEGDRVSFCKLDVAIGTAQSIWVDDQDRIYVASARPGDDSGIWRYSGTLATSADDAGGCGLTDPTGAPLVDEENIRKEPFIRGGENDLVTPTGLAAGLEGQIFVSSVFNGVINEYDQNGEFVRTILRPPAGEAITETTGYSTGTPLGMGFSPAGVLYYADIGLRIRPSGLPGPGSGTGNVFRIRFEDGEAQPPEAVATGLAFPDAIGLLIFGGGGAVSQV